jgi:acetylornithine deacetylase/succinyl-diaminopimelate desuccinylase-like protein
LRSEDPSVLARVVEQAEELFRSAKRPGVDVTFDVVGQRPAGQIPSDHPLVQLGIRCVEEQGKTAVLTAGSTDANIPLSKGLPAVVLGVTTGGGAHTLNEFIEIGPVEQGIKSIVKFVEEINKW